MLRNPVLSFTARKLQTRPNLRFLAVALVFCLPAFSMAADTGEGKRPPGGGFKAEFVEGLPPNNPVSPTTASKEAAQLGNSFDAGDSYVSLQGERKLHRLAGAVSVTLNNETEKSEIFARLTGRAGALEGYEVDSEPRPGMTILKAPEEERVRQLLGPGRLATALSSLRGTPGVRSANPVFLDPESDLWLIPNQEIIVRLRPNADAPAYFGAQWVNTRRLQGTPDQFVLTIPEPAAEQLLAEVNRRTADTQVLWAEPNFLSQNINHLTPNDSFYPGQWHLNNAGQGGGTAGADVDAPQAWDTTTGNNSIIAILDVGTQTSHPDLNSNLALNAGETSGNGVDDDNNGYIDDLIGWDFYANNNDPNPKTSFDNHGTTVAGVAAALGNNGLGIAGAAFTSRLLPIRIGQSVDSSGSFVSPAATLAQAIYYAAGRTADGSGTWRGADVLNLSFGTPSSQTVSDALTWAANSGRNGKGCPIFVSSGNGASGWIQFTLSGIPAGVHTFRWEYTKDGSVSSGDDTVWVDTVTFPGGSQERFESGGLPAGWTTGGNANWSNVQNGVGNNHALTGWDGPNSKALRAGAISHSQASFVEVTKSVGAGSITFWAWRSSEANYDYFNFYADSGLYFHVSGVPAITTNVGYPANHPDAIAVGASTDFDYRSDYSQYGTDLDFVAPSSGGASGIHTTDRTGTAGYNTASGPAGDYHTTFGGTSSAAPLASGVGALILSVNPTLTASQVRDLMRSTADKIGAVTYASGFNQFYGYGRINARVAVNQNPRPTVTSINRLNPAGQVTSAASVIYRATFSENVNNVSTADFTLVDVSGAISDESIASVSASSGTTIDVTVNTGTSGNGDLRLDVIVPGATITDDAGNSLLASFTSGQIYTIDRTPPTVLSINRLNPVAQLTTAASVIYRATFSENVNNVSTADFTLVDVSGTITGEWITSVSASSGTTIDVTVNTGTSGNGDLRLDVIVSGATITDNAGNSLASSFTAGQVYTIDHTAAMTPPTVIDVTPSFAGGTLAVGATSLRIAFSKPVTGGGLAGNYQLQSLGPDALLGTADDAIVPVSATYTGTMVTLGFAALPASVYRLTVRDTITDSSGIALDGNGDGVAGGNYVKDFVAVTASDALFQVAPTFDTGLPSTSAVTAGDFDGDGRNDLAIGSSSTGSLAVMLGRTDGTFSDPIMFGTGGSGIFALAVGDFDGDGREDLAAGHSSGVAILLGEGDGTFGAAVSYGTFARSIAVADYDGNGSLDLAVANSSNNTIGILLSNGDGSFHVGTPLTVTGIWPKSVAAGDFNGDGAKDLVMINGSFANRAVRLWLGRDNGTFTSMGDYDTQGSELESPVVGDFNGDGLQDLAVAHGTSGSGGVSTSVAVLLGQTDGNLSPVVNYPVRIPQAKSITIGDFDDDGRQDIAVATGSDRCVRLLLGLGDGTFADDDEVFGPGGSAGLLAAGDFDGDGNQDLVVATDSYEGGTFALLRGHGDGFFVATTGYGTPGSSIAVASGDFDGNGWLDLVSANRNPHNVSVYLNQGGGTLARAATYGTGGSYPSSVVVGDFNRDGHADLALNNISGNLGVLLGRGDRGDGTFDTPVTYNYAGSNSSSMSVADINGDGLQDLAVATDGAVGQRQSVSILLGLGDGTFAPAVTYASRVNFSSSAAHLAVEDFNGDGRDDVALTPGGGSLPAPFVSVFLGQSDGTLSPVVAYDVGANGTQSIVVDDFNSDSHHDLAVGVSGSMVSVLLGLGDGTFAAPLSIGTGNSFSTPLAVGDFDGDGHRDLAVGGTTVEIILGNGDGTFDSPVTFVPPGYYVSGPMAEGDYNGDGRLDLAEPNGGTMTFGLLTSALSQGLAVLQTPQELALEIQAAGFMAGQLVQGPDNAFDGLNRLQVGGANYAPITDSATDDGGRTVVTGNHNLAGLTVHREITVPATGNEDFARTVDVFQNPMGAAITTNVRIVGNLGSDAATTVFATSDGDTVIETGDQWIGTDDGDGTGTPAIVHYIHSPAGLKPTSVIRTGDNIEWTYGLTIPAGQTLRLAHFTVLSEHRADAIAAANALVTPSGFGGQAAAFLTPGELESVANFSFELPPSVVVTVMATDATAGEPYSGPGNGQFTFSRTGPTTAALTVNFTVGGTATSGTDYTSLGATVKFAAGSATATKTVKPLSDTLVEGDETVVLTLADGSSATVTIQDYIPPVVTVTAADPTAGESKTGQGTGTFTFSRAGGTTTGALTVNFAAGGTATSGTDYKSIGTKVTFAAGSATATKKVSVINDNLVEADKTVEVTLDGGDGYSFGSPSAATVTIQDDDATVTVTATDATAGEPGTGQATGTFTFTRTGYTAKALTVSFTVGGTAASGTDYTSIGTSVKFVAGSATATKTVTVLDDTAVEGDETVVVTLAGGNGYTISSPSSGTVTIQDDDGSLFLAGGDVSISGLGLRSGLNIVVEGVPFAGTKTVLRLSGQSGKRYLLEFSNDLANWAPISTNVLQSPVIDLHDTTAPALGQKFYRLLPVPDRAQSPR